MARRLLLAAEVGIAGLVWTAVIAGLSVFLLTLPVYTSYAEEVLNVPQSAGLPASQTLSLAGRARAFVADPIETTLPVTWMGRMAFDARSVQHLEDVRHVIAAARAGAGAAALAIAVWVALCVGLKRWRPLRLGMRAGAAAAGAATVLLGALAFADFDAFFTAFHSVFFSGDSWLFPSESMLIRLFPERFWVTAGVSWAVLAIALAAVLLGAARFVPSDERRPGGTTGVEDV